MTVALLTAILTFIGGLGTVFFTFKATKMNTTLERQKYYENKISEILEHQSNEIKSLKEQIEQLVKENRWLRHQLEKMGWGDEDENKTQ